MVCGTCSCGCMGTAPGCPCAGWLRTFCWNLKAGLGPCCMAPGPRTCAWPIPPTLWLGPPAPPGCCCPGTPRGGTWRMPLARGTCPPGIPCIPGGRTCCWECIGCQRGRTCCIWGVKNGRCPAFDRKDNISSLWKILEQLEPTKLFSLDTSSSTVLSVRPGSCQRSGGYSLANCRLYSCIFYWRKRGLGAPFIGSGRCQQKGDT